MRDIQWITLLIMAAMVLCCIPAAATDETQQNQSISDTGNLSEQAGAEPVPVDNESRCSPDEDQINETETEDGISDLAVTPSEITQSAFVNGVCRITTPGTYTLEEDVSGSIRIEVDRSIVLDGNGHSLSADPVHAEGQKSGVHATEDTGSVTIENFGNISGFSGTGIRSEAFRTTTIRNNVVYNCGNENIISYDNRNCQGIRAASQKVIITSNTVTDCGKPAFSAAPGPGSYGIMAMGSEGRISENTVTGSGKLGESYEGRSGSYGIFAKIGLTISDNTVTDCGEEHTAGDEEISGTGIFSQGGIISGNTVRDCGKTSGAGGETIGHGIFGTCGSVIKGNTVISSGISNGTSKVAFGYGIRSEDGTVSDNIIRSCGKQSPMGCGIQSSNGATVSGNTVTDSGTECLNDAYGIFLNGGCSDLMLTDNEITDCGLSEKDGYGVLAMNSGSRTGTESIIRNNTITGRSSSASLRLKSVSHLTMTENRISSEGTALDLSSGTHSSSRIYNNAFNASAYFGSDVTSGSAGMYAWNAATSDCKTNIVGGEWIAGNWWGSVDNTGGYSDTHTSVKGFGKEAFEIIPDSGVYDEMPLCRLSESGGGELKITGGNGYTYDRTAMTYTITEPGEYWFAGSAHAKPVVIESDDVTLDGRYRSVFIFNRNTPHMTGIYAENRSNIIIRNCQIKRGDVGINVTGTEITITGNTVSDSARYGIYTSNAEVTENSVSTKDVGIHGTGTISENIVTAPVGIEVTDEADEVSLCSDTVTSTTTAISLPSDWTGRATLRKSVIKSETTGLEINGGSGAVYNNLMCAETYATGSALASYTWNVTPDEMSGRNIMLGKYIAGNYWTDEAGNGWSDSTVSEKGYSETPFEVSPGIWDRSPLCSAGLPPVSGQELTETGGEGYTYSESKYAGCKYTINAPGYYYFGSQPHLVSISSDDVILDGRNVLFTVPAKKNVISTSGSKKNITVKNCYIDGGSIGIRLAGTEKSDVSVRDCTLRNTKSYGIYVKNGVVDGNILTGCAYGGIGYESIIAYDHAEVRDNLVRGATKNSIYYSNSLPEGEGGVLITGNRVQDGRGHGISVTGKDSNTTISSNTVLNMKESGIYITPGRNNPDIAGASVQVLENTVRDCDIGIESTVRTLKLTRKNQITGCNTGISGAGAISENTIEDCMTGIAVPAETAVPVQITENRISGADCCALCLEGSSGAVYNNLLNTGTHLSGSATAAYTWNTTPVMEENVAGGRWTAGNWWGSSDGQSGYSERNIAVNGYLGERPENHYEPTAGVCDHYPLVQTAELLPEPELSVADGEVVLDLPAVFRADCTGRGIEMCGSWTWRFTDAAGTETEVSESPAMEMEHTFTKHGHAEASLVIADRDGLAIGMPARWTGSVGCSALKIGIQDLENGAGFATGEILTLKADLPDLKDLENATFRWEFAGESLGTFSSSDAPETELSFEKAGISGIRLSVIPGNADAEKYPEGSVVCTVVVTSTPAVITPPLPEKPVRPEITSETPGVISDILVDQDDISGPAEEAGFSVRLLRSHGRDLPAFSADMGRQSKALLSFSIIPENLKDEKHLLHSAVISLCILKSEVPENEKYNLRVCRFNTISGAWEALPTTWVKTVAGMHHYEVQTPGFSDFAVVRAIPSVHKNTIHDGRDTYETQTPVKTPVPVNTTVTETPAPEVTASLTPAPAETEMQTQAPAAEAESTATAAATQTARSPGFGIITALAGAGAVAVFRGRRE